MNGYLTYGKMMWKEEIEVNMDSFQRKAPANHFQTESILTAGDVPTPDVDSCKIPPCSQPKKIPSRNDTGRANAYGILPAQKTY